MEGYTATPSRQYGMDTSPSSQQHRLEPSQPDQQLPSIRDVIPPVRSSVTEQQTPSHGRQVMVPYLSSQATSVMSAPSLSAPVAPQTSTMSYSTESTNHLQVNSLGSNLPLHTPARSPADYNSPWSTGSGSHYQEPPLPICSQPSLPSQGQTYTGLAQPMVGSDLHDSTPFSSNYSSLTRNVAMTQESPINESYGRWRGVPASTPQKYNPYMLPSERSYNHPVDYQRYGQSPYDSYRSTMGYDSTFKPLDSSPYHMKYNPIMSYPTLMGYAAQAHGRRRRGNLPKPITDILRLWLQEHLDHPYPTDEQKQVFIQRTGLTISQISNWFINARRRQLPALKLKRAKMIQSRA